MRTCLSFQVIQNITSKKERRKKKKKEKKKEVLLKLIFLLLYVWIRVASIPVQLVTLVSFLTVSSHLTNR